MNAATGFVPVEGSAHYMKSKGLGFAEPDQDSAFYKTSDGFFTLKCNQQLTNDYN